MLGLAALVTALSACSSGGGPTSLLEISPNSPEVAPGDSLQFTAIPAVASVEPVAWSVLEAGGGTIDTAGLYTAPGDEGTYTVTASLTSLSTTQSTQVRVKRNIRVDVNPSAATLTAGASLAFTANVTGSVKTVTWSVAEGSAGGTVTAAGMYTAPQTAGTYHVVATSTADPTKTGSATITVTAPVDPPPTVVSIAISPQTASVVAASTLQLTATVTGSANTGATWSVAESGGGTVTATGLYTAPGTTGTYHVLATSQADTSKSSAATLTVTAPAPAPAPTPGVGTGTSYTPSYVTNVTGGGPMPDWTTNVINAASYGAKGDGVTDDTAALQNAANTARSQGKPLVIPYTSAYYKISARISIYTSVGGVGGTPTIRQTNTSGDANGDVLITMPGMTGWIYNLRLVGTYDGVSSNSSWQWAHNIEIGPTAGLTIKGCILEYAKGDAIGTDYTRFGAASPNDRSDNVLIDSNTILNPHRNGWALVWKHDRWVFINNYVFKPHWYVNAIDFEPEIGGYITNIEISYNKLVMDPTNGNEGLYSDGFTWSVWTPANPSGGNLYAHHNYGSFGKGFYNPGGYWSNLVNLNNVAGSNLP